LLLLPIDSLVADDQSSQTDWDKVATVAKFKTPKYARDQWAIVKKKLGGASTSAAATPTSSKATPSRKRKKLEGKSHHVSRSDMTLTYMQTTRLAKSSTLPPTKTRPHRRSQRRRRRRRRRYGRRHRQRRQARKSKSKPRNLRRRLMLRLKLRPKQRLKGMTTPRLARRPVCKRR
jgi:hypothetical protein